MISAEITLMDGTRETACEMTWEKLFEKLQGRNIRERAAATVRLGDMRQGRQKKEAGNNHDH